MVKFPFENFCPEEHWSGFFNFVRVAEASIGLRCPLRMPPLNSLGHRFPHADLDDEEQDDNEDDDGDHEDDVDSDDFYGD